LPFPWRVSPAVYRCWSSQLPGAFGEGFIAAPRDGFASSIQGKEFPFYLDVLHTKINA